MNPKVETIAAQLSFREGTFKLYSQKAIALATYFGGPLAAGILIRRNSLNLGNEKQGRTALIAGIVGTILVFWGIFQIPEPIIDKIPNPLIPAIYTGIVYWIVEKLHGDILKKHKAEKNGFYSNWKAAGIGLACLAIIVAALLPFVLSDARNPYDAGLGKFTKNEHEALKLYEMQNRNSKYEIVSFINNTGIPKWKENIGILNEMSGIKNISDRFKKQNALLLEYSKLRIESYELISKAVQNETSEYDSEINRITSRIDEILKESGNP